MFIATYLLNQMDWKKTDHIQKTAYAAFLQDLSLSTDDMCKFQTDEEVDASAHTAEEKKTIKFHASKAADILSKYDKVPADVVTIVRQHHGVHSGMGLSNKSNNIKPISALFAVAARWSYLGLFSEERAIQLSKEKVLARMKEEFTFPVYQKIIKALETLNLY